MSEHTEIGFERIMPQFEGTNERGMSPKEFVQGLNDFLSLAGLGLVSTDRRSRLAQSVPLRRYQSFKLNRDLWAQILSGRLREGNGIELHDFYVTEWIPTSPGRYFTEEASEAREQAKKYLKYDREFLPLGKMGMVLGGIGSVRLKHRSMGGRELYFFGASENGISHQGIPIIVELAVAEDILDDIRSCGGSVCNLQGTIVVLDNSVSLISYGLGIPKYAILVERLKTVRRADPPELLTTVAVSYPTSYYREQGVGDSRRGAEFSYGGQRNLFVKSWTFCSFSPDGSLEPIRAAARWLQDYAGRYEGRAVPILTDFDEHVDHFQSNIEFPLKNVVTGQADLKLLTIYGNYYDFRYTTNTELTMGDRFENISNSKIENIKESTIIKDSIINHSLVQKAIKKITYDDDGVEKAEALKELALHVEESGNPEAIELTNKFAEEANKPEPSKPLLKTLWQGIKTALPTVNNLLEITAGISKLIGLSN